MTTQQTIRLVSLLALLLARPAAATTYFIGNFTGATALNDTDCGTGLGTHPSAHPCATLAYWNATRNTLTVPSDVVRLAPGTFITDANCTGAGTAQIQAPWGALLSVASADAACCTGAGTGTCGSANGNCFLLDTRNKSVTYSGWKADNSARIGLYGQVTIAMDRADGTGSATPCRGIAFQHYLCNVTNWGGHVVQDVSVLYPPGAGHFCQHSASTPAATNILSLDHVELGYVRGGSGGGVGKFYAGGFDNSFTAADANCAVEGRPFSGLSITNSYIHHHQSLQLDCIDGVTITGSLITRSCIGAAQTWDNQACSTCAPQVGGCDDYDNITGSGAINVTITDTEVSWGGEENVDAGGHPAGKSHGWTIERSWFHDAGDTNCKVSGGQDITFKNVVCGTPGTGGSRGGGFGGYSCPRFVRVYNSAIFGFTSIFTYFTNSEFINNYIQSLNQILQIDYASTNPTNKWQNNVLRSINAGIAFKEIAGGTTSNNNCTDCMGCNHVNVQYDCSLGYNQVTPCTPYTTPQAIDQRTINELTQLQADGAAGGWFGTGTAAGDQWSTQPCDFVSLAGGTPNGLQLLGTDTRCTDKGQTLASVTTDYGLRARTGTFEVGPWAVTGTTVTTITTTTTATATTTTVSGATTTSTTATTLPAPSADMVDGTEVH